VSPRTAMALALLGAALLTGCAKKGDVRTYDNSLFELASAFAAKETCSCRFVMQREEDFCREWVRVSPNVAKPKVDEEERVVTARALGMGKATARFVDDQLGCVLDE